MSQCSLSNQPTAQCCTGHNINLLQQNYCRFSTAYIGAKVKGYSNVGASESSLKAAVASTGPISVAIDASHRSLQFYTGKDKLF